MKNESPIPGLKVAGPDDLNELLPMQVPMDYRWTGYCNQWVLGEVKQGWKGRLTHLKFVPDVPNGVVYIIPAQAGEYGAIRLDYTAPETGAQLSLRIPLLRFDLEREEGRQRIFPVERREPVPGVSYMALNVIESKSAPAKIRGARSASAAGGSDNGAAGT